MKKLLAWLKREPDYTSKFYGLHPLLLIVLGYTLLGQTPATTWGVLLDWLVAIPATWYGGWVYGSITTNARMFSRMTAMMERDLARLSERQKQDLTRAMTQADRDMARLQMGIVNGNQQMGMMDGSPVQRETARQMERQGWANQVLDFPPRDRS